MTSPSSVPPHPPNPLPSIGRSWSSISLESGYESREWFETLWARWSDLWNAATEVEEAEGLLHALGRRANWPTALRFLMQEAGPIPADHACDERGSCWHRQIMLKAFRELVMGAVWARGNHNSGHEILRRVGGRQALTDLFIFLRRCLATQKHEHPIHNDNYRQPLADFASHCLTSMGSSPFGRWTDQVALVNALVGFAAVSNEHAFVGILLSHSRHRPWAIQEVTRALRELQRGEESVRPGEMMLSNDPAVAASARLLHTFSAVEAALVQQGFTEAEPQLPGPPQRSTRPL